MATFYFSRFNIEPIFVDKENKFKYTKKGLSADSTSAEKRFSYKILDFSEFEITVSNQVKEKFIAASLVKFEPSGKSEIVDGGVVSSQDVPNAVVAKSRFLMHIESGIIGFQDIAGISKKTFVEKLEQIFNLNNEEDIIHKLELHSINDDYEFIHHVRMLTNIRKVIIDLIPSNPQYGERWKKIDDKLKEQHIDKYKEVQISKSDGGIKISEETEDKFKMAQDGYGDAVVEGDLNGVTDIVSTRELDKQVKESINIEPSESNTTLAQRLWKRFGVLIARTQHNNEREN